MPPFQLPVHSPAPSERSASSSGPSTPVSPPSSFTSLLKTFGRGVSKATHAVPPPPPSPTETRDGRDKPRLVGSSSRSAGVRPSQRSVSGLAKSGRESVDELDVTARQPDYEPGPIHTGTSRSGFISSLHAPVASTSKSASTTAPSSSSSASVRHEPRPPASRPLSPTGAVATPRPASLLIEAPTRPTVDPAEVSLTPPPSKILPRLTALAQQSPDPALLIPFIRLLATSVSRYPFPPPSLSAASLSAALAVHATTPMTEMPALTTGVAPTPTPLQIYVSQSYLLRHDASPPVREAVLDLMRACVDSSLASTGGMKESEKAIYWNEARRWAEEAKAEVKDSDGVLHWRLPDADREALVAVLSSLTRGGRDLSDVPGLVALLCAFVAESIPSPAPPSPLFDPTLRTSFVRTPLAPAPYTTSLALLTALHKFSSPHIYSASTLLALRATLQVAHSPEERDLGGQSESGVLAFLGAVVRYGEVTGSKRSGAVGALAGAENEGDEILREVVSVVARIIGCEGLVGVVELTTGRQLPAVHDERVHPSILPPLALELMRDLLRSPTNQALKSLRNSLIAPPPTDPPATPVLLLVGTLRSLRNALLEHTADAEASMHRETSLATGESRWPSLLSLGLPFLWNGLRRVMQWKSEHIDAEVLGMLEERLEASRRAGLRTREASGETDASKVLARGKKTDESEGGVSYEEWDMAIEVLGSTKWHIALWEEKQKRPWVMEGECCSSHDGRC